MDLVQGGRSTIVDRIAKLIRARGYERDLLLGFASERGRIAHHGSHTESMELYLNVLKIIVERCFSGLALSRRIRDFDSLLRLYNPKAEVVNRADRQNGP